MDDLFIRATTGATRIEVAVFMSTRAVAEGARAHDISGTSAIALGRLLTATALVGLTTKRPGVTSIQILSQSRMQQVFADVTEHGWLRGYVKNPVLTSPLLMNEDPTGRRTLGPAVAPGQVSVVRMGEKNEYVQSSTPLRDGEVDSDVDHFLNQSDQVASVLRCDTLVDRQGSVVAAGGVLVRALPDSVLEDIQVIKNRVESGVLVDLLKAGATAPVLLETIAPGARETDPRMVPVWRCRCSKDKVLSTIALLDVMELAQIVAKDEPLEVRCELCNTLHVASPRELEAIMARKTSAKS